MALAVMTAIYYVFLLIIGARPNHFFKSFFPDGATRTTNSIEVPSVDEYIKKVTENGGRVVVPKTAIPNMGYFAYCLDNQGILFGISEVNANAYVSS